MLRIEHCNFTLLFLTGVEITAFSKRHLEVKKYWVCFKALKSWRLMQKPCENMCLSRPSSALSSPTHHHPLIIMLK